jgi:FkbM family methyltransferase
MMFPDHDVYIGRSLALYGEWSEGETRLFQEIVRPGDVALDVGANLGAHTLCLAHAVGAAGAVHAFEPQRMLFYFLCGNIALNGLHNVVCHPVAVGATQSAVVAPNIDYSLPNNFGALNLHTDFGAVPTYPVQQVRLDDLATPHCRLIKLDVEGMECEALDGARDLIRRTRPLLYVEDDQSAKSPALHRLLAELGYRFYRHDVFLFNPRNFRECAENVFGGTYSRSLFCHPAETPCPVDMQTHGMAPL